MSASSSAVKSILDTTSKAESSAWPMSKVNAWLCSNGFRVVVSIFQRYNIVDDRFTSLSMNTLFHLAGDRITWAEVERFIDCLQKTSASFDPEGILQEPKPRKFYISARSQRREAHLIVPSDRHVSTIKHMIARALHLWDPYPRYNFKKGRMQKDELIYQECADDCDFFQHCYLSSEASPSEYFVEPIFMNNIQLLPAPYWLFRRIEDYLPDCQVNMQRPFLCVTPSGDPDFFFGQSARTVQNVSISDLAKSYIAVAHNVHQPISDYYQPASPFVGDCVVQLTPNNAAKHDFCDYPSSSAFLSMYHVHTAAEYFDKLIKAWEKPRSVDKSTFSNICDQYDIDNLSDLVLVVTDSSAAESSTCSIDDANNASSSSATLPKPSVDQTESRGNIPVENDSHLMELHHAWMDRIMPPAQFYDNMFEPLPAVAGSEASRHFYSDLGFSDLLTSPTQHSVSPQHSVSSQHDLYMVTPEGLMISPIAQDVGASLSSASLATVANSPKSDLSTSTRPSQNASAFDSYARTSR
ncbi:hypothetical protein BC940DRAFT_370528, partial [Gongronella butleri]